ncbi:hypothetical protein UO65_2884 [Actinokineospora spheciospongiae]|uniref:Uncharacterized protein n=1 Tax=Actinokineospora spheciospongiae TaxID=909613 RepID=W7ILQ1_9PSEU|nr:hypothetical protein UO65_2884 [Actinokineospora spheciospongiae]
MRTRATERAGEKPAAHAPREWKSPQRAGPRRRSKAGPRPPPATPGHSPVSKTC